MLQVYHDVTGISGMRGKPYPLRSRLRTELIAAVTPPYLGDQQDLKMLAAIDLNLLARHVACRVRAEKEDHFRNFLRRADPAHRDQG